MAGRSYVEQIGSAVMLAAKRSEGVAPEVNLREGATHTPLPSMNKAAHSGFETQSRCHQKSKTRVSVAPQEGLTSSKILTHTVSLAAWAILVNLISCML